MSWILGIIERNEIFPADKYNVLQSEAAFHKTYGNALLLAGGPVKHTLSCSFNEQIIWAAAGLGLKRSDNSITFFGPEDWPGIFKEENLINGHYCAFSAENDTITLVTDKTGLRDLFILELNDRIIFSSRLDFLGYFTNLEFDFNKFGSGWLCINNLSTECIYRNIKRLSGGMKAVIDQKSFEIKYISNTWMPEIHEAVPFQAKDFTDELFQLLSMAPHSLKLGLSGGLDSRVLLSVLISLHGNASSTFTIGSNSENDCIIAKAITTAAGIKNERLLEGPSDSLPNIDELRKFFFITRCNHPFSSFFTLKAIDSFYGRNEIIIDGGFGEIWRREFLYRLLWHSKTAILNSSSLQIFQAIRVSKPDIFLPDVTDLMKDGCLSQINSLINSLPSADLIGIENWLDLFALKTRLLNYYGPEQSRLDSIFPGFMPFAQISLLNKLVSVPISFRKNGKLFKDIIRSNAPLLTKYGLAKGDMILPFNSGTLYSRFLSRLRRKRVSNSMLDETERLSAMREFILDTLFSSEFKSVPYYNYRNLRRMIEKYYTQKDYHLGRGVEWWLSFELNRQYASNIQKLY